MNDIIRQLVSDMQAIRSVHGLAVIGATRQELETQPGFRRWLELIEFEVRARRKRAGRVEARTRRFGGANG